MIDMKYLIRDLIHRHGNIREWIYAMSPKNFNNPQDFQYLMTKDGIKVIPYSLGCWALNTGEYELDDINKDDIVIDLGAHVGSFSLRAARYSNHVYAVEPISPDCVRMNMELNPELAKNITLMEYAIGDGNIQSIYFIHPISEQKLEKKIQTLSLKSIIQKCGGCDFLKLDIEGAEWLIDPLDLKGIRRIEVEIHRGYHSHFPENNNLIPYLFQNWDCHPREWKNQEDKGYLHCYQNNEN